MTNRLSRQIWHICIGRPIIGRLIVTDEWITFEDEFQILNRAPRWIWDRPDPEAQSVDKTNSLNVNYFK